MSILRIVQALQLNDCWIAAGVIRNKVWDYLHNTQTEINDIDVIYFDEFDSSIETEKALFRCNNCGAVWGLDDIPELGEDEREAIHFMPEASHVYMHCPSCSGIDFQVEKGRGVLIKSITFEKE